MEVIIEKNVDDVIERTYKFIRNLTEKKRHPVIGLPSGRTPILLYKKLVEENKKGNIDLESVIFFALDEFYGADDSWSFSTKKYFYDHLINNTNISPENFYFINGSTENLKEECRRYEEKIKDVGGIDLQILGIGEDGHIGFNEVGSSLNSRTRIKILNDTSKKFLAEEFGGLDNVPDVCITMGIGTILEAKRILLLAYGKSKAKAIKECVEGPVTSSFPASALQLHADVKIVIDEEAASLLKSKDYYRRAFELSRKFPDIY